MSVPGGSKGGAKTRHQSGTKLGELVGPGKEFVLSEVPTLTKGYHSEGDPDQREVDD